MSETRRLTDEEWRGWVLACVAVYKSASGVKGAEAISVKALAVEMLWHRDTEMTALHLESDAIRVAMMAEVEAAIECAGLTVPPEMREAITHNWPSAPGVDQTGEGV